MLLGPSRTLARAYRDTTNLDRTRRGLTLLPENAKCPGIWRERAKEWDWFNRAESWDQEQRAISYQKVEETLSRLHPRPRWRCLY